MAYDIESMVRTIRGIEYIIVGEHHVQDFIRFSHICPIESQSVAASADVIKRNASIGDVSGISSPMISRAWIIGDPSFVPSLKDDDIAIGVHGAVFSPNVSHAFVSDPDGRLLPKIREVASPPIGMISVATNPVLAAQWHRKSIAGIWRLPCESHDFTHEVAPHIKTQVYGLDSCAGAMHLAWLLFGCQEFVLCAADLTFKDNKPGSIELPDGRRIHEFWSSTWDLMLGVSHVFLRNGFQITCVEDTMSVPPGAAVVAMTPT